MSLLSRIQRGFRAVLESPDLPHASKTLDIILDPSLNPDQVTSIVEKQRGKSTSKLDIRGTSSDQVYSILYSGLRSWYMNHQDSIPPRDDPSRDEYLSCLWQGEPILAGAVYSMTAKMSAMRWFVTGRRLKARNFARLFAEAAHFDGYSWDGFISSTANDFYTTNRGVFWETPRIGNYLYGKLASIGHIDSLCCTLTGNREEPVYYASEINGQTIRFRTGEVIHFTSMPSPRERRLGNGFCAVDRAFRAVKLLIALHDYDDEKLNNLPPEGLAAISGLTMDEFMDALTLWKTQRIADNSLTFPQVLWLIGSQPGSTVSVDIKGFSQLPESFDREQVVSHYISTLALDFGVDAREFWPISSGSLGTASESEIQHLKAKGKGPGEFISIVERQINGEADEETNFGFDTQDIEEDMNAAVGAKAWVDVFYPLYAGTPAGKSKASPAGKPNTDMVPDQEEIPKDSAANVVRGEVGQMGAPQGPEQVITKDQILRLLADKGVLPEWMMNDQRQRIDDTSIHISKELDDNEFTSFVFEKGILKEQRLPPIILNSEKPKDDGNIPYAEEMKGTAKALTYLKELENGIFEDKRNIKGEPIPQKEVARGTRITRNTLRDELERWRAHPILSLYAPTEEEIKAKLSEIDA